MIAGLKGTVSAIAKDSIVVDVGGVGFRVFVPVTLISELEGRGQAVSLFTHLHVRESELTLYGFASEDELALCRLLQTVSGIGPRLATTMLSALPPDALRSALAREDLEVLTRVPGVGLKTAKKLAFELKDKVSAELGKGEFAVPITEADADLIAALTGLGYSVAEAQQAIRSLPKGPLPLEERVRLALAYFGS